MCDLYDLCGVPIIYIVVRIFVIKVKSLNICSFFARQYQGNQDQYQTYHYYVNYEQARH